MLLSSDKKVYQDFLEALKSLQEAAKRPSGQIETAYARVEHLFQTQVITLTGEGIAPELVPRWRSIQTELHRMFKLLATDRLFLRSSRQSSTIEQRSILFCDRLEQMMEFCYILLEETKERTDV